jgi:bifunctional non-homologous end joining protein LigD
LGPDRTLTLPQQPTAANVEISSVEWLFEPFWPGERLMARIEGKRTTLTDERGEPAGDELTAAVASVLEGSVQADQALVDGVWSARPFAGDEAEARQAFVAVDLVELDGQSLRDVPLQERRRLLESVVEEGTQVRLSPVVKHPLRSWLTGWRANGFTHYLAKHQNAPYRPGERNEDWLKLPIRLDAPVGVLGGLFGTRGRTRRIRDGGASVLPSEPPSSHAPTTDRGGSS